jgi:hypothetical protein
VEVESGLEVKWVAGIWNCLAELLSMVLICWMLVLLWFENNPHTPNNLKKSN